MQDFLCPNCFQPVDPNLPNCSFCGFSARENRERFPLGLPPGTVLAGRFIIGKVLGQGGFGITYLAKDYQKNQKVALKEFFPESMVTRSDNLTVSFFTGDRKENFDYGKECFLEEAKTLAQFIGNENIVRVYSYFEENETAYFTMEYIEGESLQEYINKRGGRIPFEDAKRILFPIMDAMETVHAKGIIHRDISPDNIYICKDNTVKLLDFGAARYSLGDRSRSLDVVLKHGYAPKEQYTRHGRQGPFTDIYSLAATFYKSITGRTPPDSIDRLEDDNIVLPSNLGADIPDDAEDALMIGLSVNPSDRFPSMSAFRQALEGQGAAAMRSVSGSGVPVYTQTQTQHQAPYPYPPAQPVVSQTPYSYQNHRSAPPKSSNKTLIALLIITMVVLVTAAGVIVAVFLSNGSLFRPVDQSQVVIEEEAPADELSNAPSAQTAVETEADAPDATAFESAEASSVLPDEAGHNYNPSNVLKNDGSCWCEGVDSYGEGEYIRLNFSGERKLYGLDIINGYAGTEKQYTYNSKLEKITIEFSGGEKISTTLDVYKASERNKIQSLIFDQPVVTSYVKITIDSVSKGECGDTCLSYVAPHPKG